jgi:hypothetical protein
LRFFQSHAPFGVLIVPRFCRPRQRLKDAEDSNLNVQMCKPFDQETSLKVKIDGSFDPVVPGDVWY